MKIQTSRLEINFGLKKNLGLKTKSRFEKNLGLKIKSLFKKILG